MSGRFHFPWHDRHAPRGLRIFFAAAVRFITSLCRWRLALLALAVLAGLLMRPSQTNAQFWGSAGVSSGATLPPGTCKAGRLFFVQTGGAPGLYGCLGPAGSNGVWTILGGGSITAVYEQSFTNATSINLDHGMGTKTLLVGCYTASDSDTPQWNSIAFPTTNRVTIGFAQPKTGRCVVLASGGVLLTGSGEVNTASNVGVSGVGPFRQKSGVNLEFFNIAAGSSRVSVSLDSASREIRIDVVPSLIDIATLGGQLLASQVSPSSKQGNGSKFLMHAGAATPGTCVQFDASGNATSTGAACGTGGGGGGSGDTVIADVGIVVTNPSAGVKQVAIDTTTVPTFLTMTANITFPAITNGTCNQQTFTLSGAGTVDAIIPGLPPTFEANLVPYMLVTATNTVGVRVCNYTGSTQTPASNQNFRGLIVRSF